LFTHKYYYKYNLVTNAKVLRLHVVSYTYTLLLVDLYFMVGLATYGACLVVYLGRYKQILDIYDYLKAPGVGGTFPVT